MGGHRFRTVAACAVALSVATWALGCDAVPKVPPAALAAGPGLGPATLVVARPADTAGLDPAEATVLEAVEIIEHVTERLVRVRPGAQEVEPMLATSWTSTPDGLEWTFHLRPGTRFQDGTPVDAAAVVFSIERQRDPFHPAYEPRFTALRAAMPYVERVEALDPLTVRITLDRPHAPFLAALATSPMSVVSPTAVKKWGAAFGVHLVGSGPFRLASMIPGDRVVLERWDGYAGEPPRLERLVFRTVPDARARLVALESGNVDVAYAIPPEERQFVELHPDLTLHRLAGLNVAYVAMNTARPPLDDRRLRIAINQAVSRDAIVKLVFQGAAQPALGPVPPSLWGHVDALAATPYDPSGAKVAIAALKADGTLAPGRRLTLYVPIQARAYLPDPARVGRAIQQHLADAGLDVDLVLQDFGKHLDSVHRGEHDLCLLGWTGSMSDPDNFLYPLLDRDNAEPPYARNVAFFRDAELHGILTYAREASDPKERAAHYARAQEIVAREAPWVPLAHADVTVATRRTVRGLEVYPTSHVGYDRAWLER